MTFLSKSNKKVPESSWCPIRDNDKLRQALIYRKKALGFTSLELSSRTGIHPTRISKYFNRKFPSITTKQLYDLADMLNVDIEINVTLK